MHPVEFLAIGDPVVDEFIRLKEASVHCEIDSQTCTISMRWGDKIPFESATIIAGVGNSANAAVAARRLGLSAALLGIVGDDRAGEDIFAVFRKEGLDTTYMQKQAGIPTNHHYVLSYESERTILVKHEAYRYVFPEMPAPKTLYLSSLAEDVPDEYYRALATFLEEHPSVFFAFQPGTFQMKIGTERLKRIYARSDIFFCNKEEAARILGHAGTPLELMQGLAQLGPKRVVVTDGRNGAYAFDGSRAWSIPMYPDTRPPFERTGAGDAFASTLTAALTLGLSFEEALLWGPINSMSVVQDIGAQRGLLPRAKLEDYLKNAPATYRISTLA